MTSSIDLRSSKTMNDQQQLCGRTEGLLLAHCKKRDCRATGDVTQHFSTKCTFAVIRDQQSNSSCRKPGPLVIIVISQNERAY